MTEHFSANLQRNTVVHGTGLPLKVLPAAAPLSAVRSSQTTAQAAAVQRHGHWLKWAGKDRWLVLFATGVRQGEAKPLGRRAALQRCWACWKRCTACTATLALSEAGVKHLRWAGVTGQGQRPRVHHRAVRSTPLGPHPLRFAGGTQRRSKQLGCYRACRWQHQLRIGTLPVSQLPLSTARPAMPVHKRHSYMIPSTSVHILFVREGLEAA